MTPSQSVPVLRPLDADGKPVPTAQEESLAERVGKVEKERDELIDALRNAKSQIEYLHGKFKQTGSGNQTLAHIESVLSRYPKP